MRKKTTTAETSTSAANSQSNDFRVRVRMYRQGLGDCFLLSFPRGKRFVHVMIDCGVVLGTIEPGVVMKKVAEDVKLTSNSKVDLLIITHEHWDHLSGFDQNQARTVFDGIEFGALWLAWTEDEGNNLANSLREEREKKKMAAKAAKEAAEKRGLTAQAERLAGVLSFFGPKAAGERDGIEEGEEGGGTAGALAYLKKKCAPTILETGGKPLSLPGVDGVRVYVLGPPQDRDAIRKTNPYKGEGYELGGSAIGLTDAFLAAFDPTNERAQPFAQTLRKPTTELTERLKKAQAEAARLANEQLEAERLATARGVKARSVNLPSSKPGIDWYKEVIRGS